MLRPSPAAPDRPATRIATRCIARNGHGDGITDPGEVAARLRDGDFAAVMTTPEVVGGLLERFRRNELILTHIDKGLAVLDPAGNVLWANPVFRSFSTTDPIGQPLLKALGADRGR